MNRFRGPSRRSPAPALMEEIEPRILFAADLAAFALPPAPGPDSAQVRLLEANTHEHHHLAALLLQSIPVDSRPAAQIPPQIEPQASQATAPATEWVVIDPLVPERDRLIADLQAQAAAQGRHFEIAVLDAQRDGLAQITELLAAHPGVAALHIVSHGSEGALHLGATQVDSAALATHAGELAQWSRALGADADILLYGCSVAAGADGQDFIARLAALTGADVAASTDLTGDATAGGNWTLESRTGAIETAGAFSAALAADWHHVIATATVTNTSDTVDGDTSSIAALLSNSGADGISLREAIEAANNTAGSDVIGFNIAGSGVHTINLLTALPTITDAVAIDGFSQTGAGANTNAFGLADNSVHLIEINGAGTTGAVSGLVIQASNVSVRGLVINHFSNGAGIQVDTGSSNVVIAGNWIGSDTTGNAAAGNQRGVVLAGATASTVGGTAAADRNVIVGNTQEGIRNGSSSAGNTFAGNYVGIGANGSTALGNGSGITVNGSNGSIIGTAGVGNVITSSAGYGLTVSEHDAVVQYNRIGTDATGTLARGNALGGVLVQASDVLIGGTAGEGNTIANTTAGAGVVVTGSISNVAILGNAIHSNSGLGLDLGGDGLTANDAGDADTGANTLQNFPVLSSVVVAGSNVAIAGSLQSAASSDYRVEFFASSSADPSGNGEGRRYLGFVNVSTDGSGNATISTALAAAVSAGEVVSATATLTNSSFTTYRSTSEFGPNVTAVSDGAPVISSNGGGASGAVSVAENSTAVTTVTATDGGVPAQTLTYSISGGTDAARFSIDAGTGALSFVTAPDFEVPTDFGANNVYQVTVRVSDGSLADTQTLNVTVTNANDAPSATVATATADGGLTLNTSGNNAYLVADNGSALLGGRTAFTLEVQFSIDVPRGAGTYHLLSYAVDGVADNEVALAVTAAGRVQVSINGIDYSTTSAFAQLVDGSVHQVSAAWNSMFGALAIYVDGTLADNFFGFWVSPGYTIATGGTLVLGQDQDIELGNFAANQAVSGTLYDARIFSDVRTGTEISTHTQATVPYDESGLLANWTFNDLSSDGQVMDTVAANNLSVGHAAGVGFTTSNPALSLAVNENAANGTVVGTVDGSDLERTQRIAALLGTDSTLRYSAETSQFYRFVSSNSNWTVAEAAAHNGSGTSLLNGVTGQLVTIRSATENEVVWNLAEDYASDVWIAASDQAVEGTWRWYEAGSASDPFWSGGSSGSNVGGAYVNWDANEPSNSSGTEQYGMMYASGGGHTNPSATPGKWNDEQLAHGQVSGRGYVVEWNADDVLDATHPLTYTIASQTVTGAFTINSDTGVITVADGSLLDRETAATHSVTVRTSDGSLTFDQTFSIALRNVYEAPVITSGGGGASSAVSVAEGSTAVASVTARVDTTGTATYSLTGGADAARFSIDASTGVLSFLAAPNYATPTDVNADNVYAVTVQVADGLGGTDTQALAVTVTNVNEAPVITSNGGGATAAISLAENTAAVTTVTSTDVDGGTLVYGISGGADAARFSIDSASGALSFAATADFENPADANADNVYQVSVQVSDGTLTDTQALSITVTAANDNAPVITSNGGAGTALISVAENNTAVTTVTATDADLPAATRVYSIAGGADAARFSIDGSTGVLSFVTAPDYETPADANADNVYQVTVQASDGSLVDTQALSITVTAANESAPVITSNGGAGTALISLAENSTAVTTVTATDADLPAATLVYSIAGGADAARFSINGSTGVLSFVTAPDFEVPADANADNVYQVTVQASDGSLVDTQALSVTVTAANESAPTITSNGGAGTAALSLAENSTAVTTVTATDADLPAATLVYSIAGGADAARFSIDGSTGVLSFVTAPDFETPADANADNVYQVTVQASDGSLAATQALSVTVTAVNESAPVITSNGGAGSASISVAENSTAVTTVTATDADLPAPTLVYSITGGADAARFSIDGSTGLLSFVTAPDYESPADANADNIYQVTVQASDGGLAATQALSVTVTAANDNAPVITSNGGAATAALSVAENGTTVTTVTATDADSPAPTLVYSIAGGADAARFSIDTSTGVLNFASAPDYDNPADANADNIYQVTVQASDGSLAATQALSITVTAVNDNTPVITSDGGTATASLNLAENSTAVTTVTATDADLPASTLAYSITGGADAARFSIDGSTGRLSFTTAPDYETPADTDADNVYHVTVQASDGSLSATQALSITVTAANDNAPIVTSNGGAATASVSVAENGTAITTVTATDADLPAATLVYRIAGGADAARFSIDSSTGVLSFVTAPDFETPADANADNVYQLTVQASDGSLATTQALSITVIAVNDNSPVITSDGGAATASLNLVENSTTVTTVMATDADLPAATLVYSIAGGADAARFSINGSTGVLSFVTAPDFEAPADADADNVYQVTVQASDGSLATTQALSITVTAANDNTPVITSNGGAATASVSVAENGTAITTVTATDADLPAATLLYRIAGGADAARFSIDSSTGVLRFVTAPDFETPADANADNVYQLTVQASDGSLATTQALSIIVTAVNDNTPVIASNGGGSTAVLATAENVTAVTTVQATDADQPTQALTYSIVGGADAARLRIDSATGLLSFVTPPDHEAPGDADGDNVYQVTVQASDGTYADTQTLTLSVGDVNDNAPVVTPGQRFVLAEISSNGAVLGRVLATDADSVASLGQWAISSGNIGGAFAIDPATGRITVANAGRLDYETTPTYTLRIRVSDGGLVSAEQTVTIVLTDVREPVPAPVPVPGVPEVTDPVPVFTVPGTAAAAPSPAPAPASSSPARGDAGDDTPEFALTTEFNAPPPSAVRSSQAVTSSSGAVRRTASGELLSSVAGGTVSLDIDLVDLAEADSESTGWAAPADDTNRSVRVRAAQDGASRPAPSNDDLAIWAAKASAALLGAGFVWWSLRASGLLASLAASTPVWRHLDPIPILGGDDGTGYSTFDTAGPPQWDDEAARDEAASRELLDEARRNLDTVIS